MTRILLSSPDVTQLEEEYVLNSIRSGWIAPVGPDLSGFEDEMADRIGVSFAVGLASGTAALHLALLSLNVGRGDVVITSTMTFAATANAITYTGARPFFVDSDPATGNMDPKLLELAIEHLRATGENVAAVVPVDLFGKPVDYTSIQELSERFGLPIIADAAESVGAVHAGRAAGAWGKASIFSFNGNKIMTTSGGGMVLTNDRQLAERVRYLATQARQPVAHYEHEDIGFNYRLSNLLAALGRSQLKRLDSMISRRRDIRQRYKHLFSKVNGVHVLGGEDDASDNCWLSAIIVDSNVTGWTRQDLQEVLNQAGIESRPLWKPMHMQPIYKDAGAMLNGSSEALFEKGLALPSGSALKEAEISRVEVTITDFLVNEQY